MCSSGSSQIKWIALSALSILSGSCSKSPGNGSAMPIYNKSSIDPDKEHGINCADGYPLKEFLQFCKKEKYNSVNKKQKLYYKHGGFMDKLRDEVGLVEKTDADGYLYRSSEPCVLLDGYKKPFAEYFVAYFPDSKDNKLMLIKEKNWKSPYGSFPKILKEDIEFGDLPTECAEHLLEADRMVKEYNDFWPAVSKAPEENATNSCVPMRTSWEKEYALKFKKHDQLLKEPAHAARVQRERKEAEDKIQSRLEKIKAELLSKSPSGLSDIERARLLKKVIAKNNVRRKINGKTLDEIEMPDKPNPTSNKNVPVKPAPFQVKVGDSFVRNKDGAFITVQKVLKDRVGANGLLFGQNYPEIITKADLETNYYPILSDQYLQATQLKNEKTLDEIEMPEDKPNPTSNKNVPVKPAPFQVKVGDSFVRNKDGAFITVQKVLKDRVVANGLLCGQNYTEIITKADLETNYDPILSESNLVNLEANQQPINLS